MTRAQKMDAPAERGAVADVARQLAALREMTTSQLRERYREVFGEPTRSRNKAYLQKKIAWRIQELAEGGLSDHARARIEELATDAPIRWRASRSRKGPPAAAVSGDRDPRLPSAGTELTRCYKGDDYRVAVLQDGFDFQGRRYGSLSKIAREITGTNWNGFLFFGLKRRTRKTNGEVQG